MTASSVRALAAEWGGNLRAIKQCSRAGMGQCQGPICEATVVRIAAEASARAPSSIGRDTPRNQIKPMSLAALAEPVAEP